VRSGWLCQRTRSKRSGGMILPKSWSSAADQRASQSVRYSSPSITATVPPQVPQAPVRAAASVDFPAPLRPSRATKTGRCDAVSRAVSASTSGCASPAGMGTRTSRGERDHPAPRPSTQSGRNIDAHPLLILWRRIWAARQHRFDSHASGGSALGALWRRWAVSGRTQGRSRRTGWSSLAQRSYPSTVR